MSGVHGGRSVLISGLTAAGKTTHASLLAHELGYRPVHFTDLLLRALGIGQAAAEQVWFTRLYEIESMRQGASADVLVDRQIRSWVERRHGLVVDAVLSPWLCPDDPVRVWIGSDRLSRAFKCTVSRLPESLPPEESVRLVDEKDRLTREFGIREYGIDTFVDRDTFDLVLDNSHLIDAPTRAASDRGIVAFQAVLGSLVRSAVSGDHSTVREFARRATREQLASIVAVGPRLDGLRLLLPEPATVRPVLASRYL